MMPRKSALVASSRPSVSLRFNEAGAMMPRKSLSENHRDQVKEHGLQ